MAGTCSMCSSYVTTCCLECSTATCVVPLCKERREWKGKIILSCCAHTHRTHPESTRRSTKRASMTTPAPGKRRNGK